MATQQFKFETLQLHAGQEVDKQRIPVQVTNLSNKFLCV